MDMLNMYIYIYIHILIYTHIYICILIYVYTHTRTYIYIHIVPKSSNSGLSQSSMPYTRYSFSLRGLDWQCRKI